MSIETHTDAIMLRWTPEQADLGELTRRPAFRRQMAKWRVVAAILLAVGLVLLVTGAAAKLGVFLAVVGGLLLLWVGIAPRNTLQQRWKHEPLIQDSVEYVADKRGLSRRQQDFECWWGWSRISKVEESSHAFILSLGVVCPSDGPFLLLSKRGLAGPADETRLRELLDAQVGRRGR